METIKLQGRSEGAGSSTTYFPARTVSSFFSLLVLWRREVARRSNPLVGFFHPNFIQVERVQFHTSSSTTYDKILFTGYFCMFRAGIANLEIADPTTTHSLCALFPDATDFSNSQEKAPTDVRVALDRSFDICVA